MYEDIVKEVDDVKFEKRRMMFKGMFRDIQDGHLSDYDFRHCNGYEDAITVQLNPFCLTEGCLNLDESNEYSEEATAAGDVGHEKLNSL